MWRRGYAAAKTVPVYIATEQLCVAIDTKSRPLQIKCIFIIIVMIMIVVMVMIMFIIMILSGLV